MACGIDPTRKKRDNRMVIMFRLNTDQLKRIGLIILAFAVLGAAFAAGAWYGYENRPAVERVLNVTGQEATPDFQNIDFNLFWDVWSRLEDKYVDKDTINRQDLVYGAVEGLVKSLKDPYTEFMPPAETKQFQQDINGSFDGIGAEIGIRKGVITVIAPLKGMPAERVGLKAGDKILKINATSTADMALDEAVRLIRGQKGTKVQLTIFRDSFSAPKDFDIIRATIKVEILTTEKKGNGIFVIKLHSFTQTAPYEFRKALQEFSNSGSTKLVLDLRNNPGGFLEVSVDITSWFLPSGDVVVREKFADGSENIHRSRGFKFLEQVPTVVLVNEGSASASEIVAGALRDNKNIQLVGAKTFGKGSVQEVLNLPDGSSLKVTIAKWLTPKGEEINGKGLEPDIMVELPKEGEEDPAKDPILEKGIEVLKNK